MLVLKYMVLHWVDFKMAFLSLTKFYMDPPTQTIYKMQNGLLFQMLKSVNCYFICMNMFGLHRYVLIFWFLFAAAGQLGDL